MVDQFFLATKAFIVNDGDILVVREAEDYAEGTRAGRFDVPGGRLEPGEHFGESLLREVQEETGLDIAIGQPFHVDEWRPVVDGAAWQIVGVFFACEAAMRDVTLGEDHTDHAWIAPDRHRQYDLIENLHPVFEAFLGR